MITRENYLKKIEALDLSKIGQKLDASKAYFDAITKDGTDWTELDNSPTLQALFEQYLKALNVALKKQNLAANEQDENDDDFSEPMRSVSSIKRTDPVILELRYLRRYINLDGRKKTKRQIKLFLSAVQRSIVSRQIRKSSQYAADIMTLQNDLIEMLERFKTRKEMSISIDRDKEQHILNLLGRKAEPKAYKLLKEFVNLQGTTLEKDELRLMHNKIGRYLNRRKFNGGSIRDAVSQRLLEVTAYLKELYNSRATKRKVDIDNKTLQGIEGLEGYAQIEPVVKAEKENDTASKKKVIELT